jgi:chromosome segregation ATPase
MIEWIKAFCVNVWSWFIENKDSITAFFMSGQAISFVAAIIMLIKNLKGTKANTASTETLNKTLTNTNEMSVAVKTLEENFQSLKQENDLLRTELAETETRLQEVNSEIKNKLNAIVEVQAIVYSTIRDDGVRQTVNTILNNARYSEKNFKQELETQIAELKENYSNELKAVNEKMAQSMDKITEKLSATETAKTTMAKKIETTRY